MTKKLAILSALVLTLALAPLALAQTPPAQQGTITGSGIQIQNLTADTAANVELQYYPGNGAAAVPQQVTVPGGESLTLLSFDDASDATPDYAVGEGFQGSVVITSDQPVAAITNLIGSNSAGTPFAITEGYPGVVEGAQTLNAPLIVRNNPVGANNASTTISVQNASDSAVNGTITYTPGADAEGNLIGNEGVTDSFSLGPGESTVFAQFAKTELGDRFVGSATISADGNIAATVQQEGNDQLNSYAAFASASGTASVPLVIANNNVPRAFTGIQIQNAGNAETTVTVNFSDNSISQAQPGVGLEPCGTNGVMESRQITIAAGASSTLITQDLTANTDGIDEFGFDAQFRDCRYIGSATIDGGGQNVVAIVNQTQTSGSLQGSAYEGFDPAVATSDVRAPLVAANNFGLLTGVQVQNTGTAPADVTIDYSTNTYTSQVTGNLEPCATEPESRTATVQGGASFTFVQLGVAGLPDGLDTENGLDSQFTNCTYIGSATITGGEIVSVVNQQNLAPAQDTLTTYNAFNQ
jgi:hypothetical protein